MGIALKTPPVMQTGCMADEPGGVTVTGVGTVRVPTTEAAVRLLIARREAQPGAAMREAAALVAVALESLRASGVPDKDVRTTSVSVSPNKVWADDHEEIQGYDAQQRLHVRVTDLDVLDELLGRLVERCGTGLQIDDVSLSGEPSTEARSLARRQAIDDAREKALDYAQFVGRALGTAESVDETVDVQRPLPPPRGRMAMAVAESMPIAQGEDTTTVTVRVHWQFE